MEVLFLATQPLWFRHYGESRLGATSSKLFLLVRKVGPPDTSKAGERPSAPRPVCCPGEPMKTLSSVPAVDSLPRLQQEGTLGTELPSYRGRN